jgi:hypothetical protein
MIMKKDYISKDIKSFSLEVMTINYYVVVDNKNFIHYVTEPYYSENSKPLITHIISMTIFSLYI